MTDVIHVDEQIFLSKTEAVFVKVQAADLSNNEAVL